MIETYSAVALSTAHLRPEDDLALRAASKAQSSMVLARSEGYFIKLHAGGEGTNTHPNYSDELNAVLQWATESGHQLVEFDCDAAVTDRFPSFVW